MKKVEKATGSKKIFSHSNFLRHRATSLMAFGGSINLLHSHNQTLSEEFQAGDIMNQNTANFKDFLIMPKNNLSPESKIIDALKLFKEYPVVTLPVLDDQHKIMGAISIKDVISKIALSINLNVIIKELINNNLNNVIIDENFNLTNFKLSKLDIFIISKNKQLIGILPKVALDNMLCHYYKQRFKEREAIFKCALNGIIIVNKDGIITDINPAAEKITGLTAKKTIGKRPEQICMPRST